MTEPLLDFETAMAQQSDLKSLCAERPRPQREAHWPNENYGFSTVLRRYSGYPDSDPIYAVIPHGVYLSSDSEMNGPEAQAPMPAAYTYPEYLDRLYRRLTNKHVIPSASPFLYALELAGEVRVAPERVGTMFFPAHSTMGVRVDAPHELIASMLLELPEEYQPVTVCVHWFDYSQGMHKPYAKRGLRIVSAGHVADQQFLFRLIHLLSTTRFAASNALGSNAFYAMAMGIPYFLLDTEVTHNPLHGRKRDVPSEKQAARNARLREMLLARREEVTPELAEETRYYLGAERLKSRDSLLTDLIYARRLVRGW